MERIAILLLLVCLALVAGLSSDPDDPTEPAPSSPDSDGLRAGQPPPGAELASDPRIARCIRSGAPQVPELPELEDLEALVVAVSAQVAGIRQLAFERPVDARFLDSKAIERRIGELIAEESTPRLIADQGEALTLLGAIPPGSDLGELNREALTSQVAGLYVPSSGELLVRADGRPGALELVTLAHELEHVLADQALGVPLPERAPAGRSDSLLARQAVVEGDATLTMSLYELSALEPADQLSLLAGSGATAGMEQFEALPDLLQRQLLFPYLAGLELVCDRYLERGWRGVDDLYYRPPRSSAAVLFPRRPELDPVEAPRLGRPGRSWRPALADELGAAPLLWLLEAPGGDPDRAVDGARAAAAAWRGGESRLWHDDDRSALGISFASEDESICEALGRWYPAAFGDPSEAEPPPEAEHAWEGPGQAAVIDCVPGGVRLGIGPGLDAAAALAG